MTVAHILGFPRIGAYRETKKAVEAYWRGDITQEELIRIGEQIRVDNWKLQKDAGLDFVSVGDFSWYDHVLDTSALLGVVPERFGKINGNIDINTYFCMARGQAPKVSETTACEMTKWFNTNYHYIVPEFTKQQSFQLSSDKLFQEIDQAQKLGHKVKPVILGPLSYLWLGKTKGDEFNKLDLLEKLIPVYNQIFKKLAEQKITWVQIDEPILILDLPDEWHKAFVKTYQQLDFANIKCLLATYFGGLNDNLNLVNQLPVQGLHIDYCTAPQQLTQVLATSPNDRVISVGIINGRNIWKTDILNAINILTPVKNALKDRLWISSSCSLLHVPVDLDNEHEMDAELKSWLAFAKQKLAEITLLANVLEHGENNYADELVENTLALQSRQKSARIHHAEVKERVKQLTAEFSQRKSAYRQRAELQRKHLGLPLFPTTSIGSFPQTNQIRSIRQDYKSGKINETTYISQIKKEIAAVIQTQEELGMDVLVHGEAERNDMVEYFGELLNGFAFTKNGWVQSYGSRCVKPPIIYGDVSRPSPMTVTWAQYAQSLTKRHVKGMLTGPVTILAWSFVRDDQPNSTTALQLALVLRDEVCDLEKAGISIIQIDEPAFRESLPLRKADWQNYLDWAVYSFRVSASGVTDKTQIHTHMCYSEFNDVISSIADLDADVITIESSRSEMELLKAFDHFAYPNEIGPGVYDIHSPRIPSTVEIVHQLEKAARYIPAERLWVNPDCGLKTRQWPEVKQALTNMVNAAKTLREKYHERVKDHA